MNISTHEFSPELCDIEAERAVIGAALFDTNCRDIALARLGPYDFYVENHQAVWHVIGDRVAHGKLTDPLSVSSDLGPASKPFLLDVFTDATVYALAEHVELIADMATRRRLLEASRDVAKAVQALGDGMTGYDHVAQADRTIHGLLNDAAPSEVTLVNAHASALATLDEIDQEAAQGRAKGFMTGLRCFDRRMRGLRPGWLVVVAGRPSMGKTALARAAAFGCARKNPNATVLFFALEMARRELDERTLSQLSYEAGDGIAYKDMNGDSLAPEDRAQLRLLAQRIPTNFQIDDSPILSVEYVRRRVLAMRRKGPIAAVFIDYLQIMDRPDAKGRNEASVIGHMTKALKQLAREAQTCVVLLSQINRGVESRDDKRPQLSDLRESGAIEQDANAVFFPYREVYYLERLAPKTGSAPVKLQEHDMAVEECRRKMDVICAKVRQGAVGTDHQVYFAEYDHVEDRAEDRR